VRLNVGESAPIFSKVDLRGEVVDLGATKGKPVWIGFFRFATCPLCNLRVHQMISAWPRFEKRCRYVAVFQSPPERFEGFLTKHSPPFPVIADPAMELFKAYKLENSLLAALKPQVIAKTIEAKRLGFPVGALSPKDGAALRVPGDFIVGTDGKLKLAFYGTTVAESVPLDVADRQLAQPAA